MRFLVSLILLIGFATPALAQNEVDALRLFLGATGSSITFVSGFGSPEGVVTAPVSQQYYDITTGKKYRKASGGGNTGWVAEEGTVTSVGMTVPYGFGITGSPITSSGTLALSLLNGFMIPGGGGTTGTLLVRDTTPGWSNANLTYDNTLSRLSTLEFVSTATSPTLTFDVTQIRNRASGVTRYGSGWHVDALSGWTYLTSYDETGNVWTPMVLRGSSLRLDGPTTVKGDLTPRTTDTYTLGSPALLWKNGYLSQLTAILFALETQTLFGRYSTVGHGAGSFGASLSDSETAVDFGQSMTPGDWVLVRATDTAGTIGAEYMLVGALVSGTTYTTTRGVAASTPRAWAEGVAYLVLGAEGDGRIDLLATNGRPRIVVTQQGATATAETPRTVLGNMNSYCGYATDIFGLCAGDADASHITVDPVNGVRIRFGGTTKIGLSPSGDASFSGEITAPSGSIGGWTIGADYLRDSANTCGMASTVTGGDDVRWWCGAAFADRATAPMRLTEAGLMTLVGATLTGPDITIGASSSYSSSGAVKFNRMNGATYGYGQTDDVFGLWSMGATTTQLLTLENVVKGGAVYNAEARTILGASGWQASGTVSTQTAYLDLRSRVDGGDIRASIGGTVIQSIGATGTTFNLAAIQKQGPMVDIRAYGAVSSAGCIGGLITSNSLANPSVVTTAVNHGLTTGDVVLISGVSSSSPTINGLRTVTVLSTTTFSVAVNVTTAGTGGIFGVVDGIATLNDAAFVAAIAAAGYGTVYVPAGNWRVSDTIDMTTTWPVNIKGAGMRNTNICSSVSGKPAVRLSIRTTQGQTISDLDITHATGTLPIAQIGGTNGIRAYNLSLGVNIERVMIRYFPSDAIAFLGQSGPSLVKDVSTNNNAGYGVALFAGDLVGATYEYPADVTVQGGAFQHQWGGIYNAGGASFSAYDVDIELGIEAKNPCVWIGADTDVVGATFSGMTCSFNTDTPATTEGALVKLENSQGATWTGGVTQALNDDHNFLIVGANSINNLIQGGYHTNGGSGSSGYFVAFSGGTSTYTTVIGPDLNLGVYQTGKGIVNDAAANLVTTIGVGSATGGAKTNLRAPSVATSQLLIGAASADEIDASVTRHSARGFVLQAIAGSSYDFSIMTPSAGAYVMRVPTGTSDVAFPAYGAGVATFDANGLITSAELDSLLLQSALLQAMRQQIADLQTQIAQLRGRDR